ncbi:class I fructose-bisphosphate aldolase [Maribacter polysiphoniae]|uniref:fructose-bisphosphate aldolase n=2 Tax=Flavobacteriaceae TaxID=49546 RepID=A0A316E2A1_9FLAO|nr:MULTISPECIES: class I fructose-bisphosphate aldolase [Flavobacteriaceae]MBD1260713.1 class I fructose-bisphosphate aldolase [Maribacter polysiphoniae]PWK24156.1 fructose-bisphosphate aldolase, class I [Maribacter polysiphoniae]RPG33589.1 MAG: class I fructose-bisphosphate aldolase [Muricauda sp. TMED12]RYC51632.1 fructose-bisphosphate aldolase [Allomuricauda olearia]|tara:strand:- start:9476 stop:10537 length:1062 start_codon:yes stop_codon:yes gene_type:complete
MNTHEKLIEQLGDKASFYLDHVSEKITKDELQLPDKNFVSKVFVNSNRNPQTLRSLAQMYGHGNLKDTGYLSILPVDQGIEHSAAFSFYKNPDYFDPENIIKLAIGAGCNGVASTFGVLGLYARKYAHKIPFIVKINHNELLSYPNAYDQTLFGKVKDAWDMGAVAIGATIYFGSKESNRQIVEIAEAFAEAHRLGMATILWCYTRNNAFKTDKEDFHTAADLTGQANHLGVTIQADIIKQKLPTTNYGFKDLQFGKYDDAMYETLTTEHPIDLCRLQVANCYMGKIGLISSGGGSKGASDMTEAITTAIVNKRAGGSGLILGRKAFQRPIKEGVELLHAVQSVYLEEKITIA